jgi:hypothetical protein
VSDKPCDTCAFRKGCVTHENEPHNRLRAEVCASGPLPFHCHYSDAGDWSELDLSDISEADAMALRRELPICAGWKAEVAKRAAAGHYPKETRTIRRHVAAHALKMISQFIRSPEGPAKNEARIELTMSLKLLARPKKSKAAC